MPRKGVICSLNGLTIDAVIDFTVGDAAMMICG
jgi:hypothetical protein